jgi:hypothetical protein
MQKKEKYFYFIYRSNGRFRGGYDFAKLNHDLKKSSKNVTFFHLEASYGYYDEILYPPYYNQPNTVMV